MISFEAVSFSYRGGDGCGAGVRDISLHVHPGTCVLVCGASGCGKTTITRLANGLAPSFFPGEMTGRVLLDGQDVTDLESWEVAKRVGSVFQNPRTQFFNVDSTGEVAFALESMAWPEERVRARTHETIAELGLQGLADRSIFSLSGGEKQRIAYASAWAAHPANLVLDEPTSNLDMDAIADLRRYVQDAKAKGAAVLVAEHRLWWLADVADEVLFMREGRIVRTLSGAEFRALPASEVRALGLRARDLDDVRTDVPDGAGGCAAKREQGVACTAFVPAATPLVEARGVQAAYKKHEVLRGVNLAVASGEVVALVGRNGAGKSTLCRTLVGLHKEADGVVLLAAGVRRASDTSDGDGLIPFPYRDRLACCSMVFQDVNYQLFAESVRAEVSFGLEGAERPTDDRVANILADLNLSAFAERHPATLSGGQKQRLAVAACIAANKRLLVFDEPTSGLDLGSMQRVARLARSLADGGRSVLVVTHDLELIACVCDRALQVADGRIVAEAVVAGDLAEVRALLQATR